MVRGVGPGLPHRRRWRMVDPDFARHQLAAHAQRAYLHPNGQIPAYEWNFGDVNPPVHAWATLFAVPVRAAPGARRRDFLRDVPQADAELHLVGQPQGPDGKQRLRGRLPRPRQHRRVRPQRAAAHRRPPRAGRRHGLDGFFCQNMLDIALELAEHDPSYEDIALKFFEHSCGSPRDGPRRRQPRRDVGRGGRLLLRRAAPARRHGHAPEGALHGGAAAALRATVFEADALERFPQLWSAIALFTRAPPRAAGAGPRRPTGRRAWPTPAPAAVLNEEQAAPGPRAACSTRSGSSGRTASGPSPASTATTRSSSTCDGQEFRVEYLPAESDTGMFGGNSNWRGPVWMPVNSLIIRACCKFYATTATTSRVECPTGSGSR